ncbi:hypothetical protein [Maioricimonas sp. JC845]|uniref:hypothetical protein n=1 Tax=Maioricimonas sp. JC845 TaxID=3232138 RepID=UPI00345A7BE8
MKGPGLRLDLEVRRLWRCPKCGLERRVPDREVTVICDCTESGTFMQLIEPKRTVRAEPPPLDPFLDIELEPSSRRPPAPEPQPQGEPDAAPTEPVLETSAAQVPQTAEAPPPEAAPSEATPTQTADAATIKPTVKPEEKPQSEPRKPRGSGGGAPRGSDPQKDGESSEKKRSRGRRRGGRGNRRRRGGRGRSNGSGDSSPPSSENS